MTAPESELFSASDRCPKRKIRMDDSFQRVPLRQAGLNLALGTLPTYSSLDCEGSQWRSSSPLDPAQMAQSDSRCLACANVCTAGGPAVKRRCTDFWSTSWPEAGSCLSIHLGRVPKCRKCLRIRMGHGPRWAQTPPGPHSAACPPSTRCPNPVCLKPQQ